MNYEEIKQKYAGQAKERAKGTALAQNRVERIQAQIDYHTKEREQYRGIVKTSACDMWKKHTHEIMLLNDKLKAAQLEKSRAEIGEDGLNSIDNFIK